MHKRLKNFFDQLSMNLLKSCMKFNDQESKFPVAKVFAFGAMCKYIVAIDKIIV